MSTTMPRPIAVSDQQLSAIMTAVEALSPLERSAFLTALAHRLRGERDGDIGDGLLHRAVREVLREIGWRPPTVTPEAVHNHRRVGEPIA